MRAARLLLCVLAALCALAPATAVALTRVTGGGGPDRLAARAAVEHLIRAGGGHDRAVGGPLNDRIYGETGHDTLFGRGGDDLLDGSSGDDSLYGEAGSDTLVGSHGHDTLDGGDGADSLDAGAAPDKLAGGAGDDLIHAGSGIDQVDGGDGDDTIYTDSGSDSVVAGPGNDTIHANTGNALEIGDCGPGDDVIYINPYRSPGGISNAQAVREGRIRGCERIIEQPKPFDPTAGIRWMAGEWSASSKTGTDRNDTLLGGHGSNRLFGAGGDDLIWGDHLHADGGASARRQRDHLDGGPGNDTVYGGRGRHNRILGGDGDDFLQGYEHANTISGDAGNDQIRLRAGGRNRVDAGAGDDTVTAIIARGRAYVRCGPGADTVVVSRWRLNRARVRVARDCERVRRG